MQVDETLDEPTGQLFFKKITYLGEEALIVYIEKVTLTEKGDQLLYFVRADSKSIRPEFILPESIPNG